MRVARLALKPAAILLGGAIALAGCSSTSGGGQSKSADSAAPNSERWVVISNSIANTSAPIIFQGAFTAGGTGINGQFTNKIVLPGGTFILDHHGVTAKQHLYPSSCLETLIGSGPYTLRNGTGRYAGIKGHGTLTLNVRFVLPRTRSGCNNRTKPLAYVEIDSGTGPVFLKR